MTSGSSATTKPTHQPGTTPSLGGILHEWRQWLAPGVVVTVVLATASLQRADLREFKTDVQADIQEFKTDVRADIGEINDRIDQVNDRVDRLDAKIDRLDGKIDRVNDRIDRLYQLLLP